MLAFTSLATLALPLLASCVAATPITTLEARSLDAQSIQLAVASGCSGKGVSAGSVTLTVTIPTTLADVAAGLSFFHPPNAAAVTVTGASGTDNAAGATRTLTVDPRALGLNTTVPTVRLSEKVKTLDDFEPYFLDRVWTSSAAAAVSGGIAIPSHSSHLVLTPSCSMEASTLTFTTSFCASDTAFAEALFQGLQEKSVDGLTAMYGAFSACSNL